MTSSLPDFSANSAASTATSSAALAELMPGMGTCAVSATGTPPEFAALMAPEPGEASSPTPTGNRDFSARAVAPAGTSVVVFMPGLGAGAAPASDFGDLMTPEPVGASLLATAQALAVELIEEPAPSDQSREIPRDTLEQAAAFVAALLQPLLPGVPLAELIAAGRPEGAPQFSVAADGALELKLTFPAIKPGEKPSDVPAAAEAPGTISAELELPGATVVRFEITGLPAMATIPVAPQEREIFAGKYPGRRIAADSVESAGERNFVSTGDKQVKPLLAEAGITVAKSDSIMPAAPTEDHRFARKPDPLTVLAARVEFEMSGPSAERITVPAAEAAGQNLAARAVETVTNLVEAQFSASMQKSGSVQLRLQFGGEDLRVRVELRDGAVHTDFRTDSPELRTALTREWQAVAASAPEQALRYLDPVFSSAPASASTDSQQHPARQQQQPQQDFSQRSQREGWTGSSSSFTRRTQLTDSFVPEPSVARGPVFLPTSSRLSVLA